MELAEPAQGTARLWYGRAKRFMALGIAMVIVPTWLLILLTPYPGVPSPLHVLPLELYYVCFGAGVVVIALGVVNMARVERALEAQGIPR